MILQDKVALVTGGTSGMLHQRQSKQICLKQLQVDRMKPRHIWQDFTRSDELEHLLKLQMQSCFYHLTWHRS
jgi:hypothetical protein